MKVWFDKQDVVYEKFISEQFLILPLFEQFVVYQNKDFIDSNEWIDNISNIIEYVNNVEDSDVIIYPYKLDSNIKKYINISINTSKKLICFYNDDNDAPSCLPDNVDVYRTSLYSSRRKKTEFGLPAWSCDFTKLTTLNYLIKKTQPIVGFCGAITHKSRQHAIELLNHNNQIITDFKIRNRFWGGDIHNPLIRNEYVSHMVKTDLVLCCRGAGNFSYRLYECMSLGKIPIIINTDITLPCSDIISWKDIGVWVDNIDDINYIINNYWSNITNEEYINRQKLNRKLYDDFLSPVGFAKYLSNKYTKI